MLQPLQLIQARLQACNELYFNFTTEKCQKFLRTWYAKCKISQIVIHFVALSAFVTTEIIYDGTTINAIIGHVFIFISYFASLVIGMYYGKWMKILVLAECADVLVCLLFYSASSAMMHSNIQHYENSVKSHAASAALLHTNVKETEIPPKSDIYNYGKFYNASAAENIFSLIHRNLQVGEALVFLLLANVVALLVSLVFAIGEGLREQGDEPIDEVPLQPLSGGEPLLPPSSGGAPLLQPSSGGAPLLQPSSGGAVLRFSRGAVLRSSRGAVPRSSGGAVPRSSGRAPSLPSSSGGAPSLPSSSELAPLPPSGGASALIPSAGGIFLLLPSSSNSAESETYPNNARTNSYRMRFATIEECPSQESLLKLEEATNEAMEEFSRNREVDSSGDENEEVGVAIAIDSRECIPQNRISVAIQVDSSICIGNAGARLDNENDSRGYVEEEIDVSTEIDSRERVDVAIQVDSSESTSHAGDDVAIEVDSSGGMEQIVDIVMDSASGSVEQSSVNVNEN